jgi:biopolymer transport protein TolR
VAKRPSSSIAPVINVTPLVDVVLVLLIIFMVIIPNMQEGKTIEMMKVEIADALKPDEPPITVTVSFDETYAIETTEVSRDGALQLLSAAYAEDPRRKVLVRGDTRLPYRTVRELFADVQEIGFGNVALAVGVNREWSEEG